MLTTVFVFLATVVAAGWISARARVLAAFASIVTGIILITTADSSPTAALGAAVLMAAGSVALGGLYFGPRTRLAFGAVTAMPFAFVGFAAWPLTRNPTSAEGAIDLILLASAGVVALVALSIGQPKRKEKPTGSEA